MAAGAAKDFAEYQLYVGYNLAYDWMLDEMGEMLKKAYRELVGEEDD